MAKQETLQDKNKRVTSKQVLARLEELANPARSKVSRGFFKTGKGEYGEGDVFLGIPVPTLRGLVREYHGTMQHNEVLNMLHSEKHEARLFALLLFVREFPRASSARKTEIYKTYLANTKFINNWDLVDSSAEHIVGGYLNGQDDKILDTLAASDSLWERRIAMLATFHFIRKGEFKSALRMANHLRNDTHDLIHKAVGWMLREIAERDEKPTKQFLDKHAGTMPRTMLRYAIEKFPVEVRNEYLAKKLAVEPVAKTRSITRKKTTPAASRAKK